jgi:hypothetical protein
VKRAAFGKPNRRATGLALLTALVLAASGGCAAKVGRSPSSPRPAGIDHKWRLTQVTADGKTTTIPDSVTATVQLTADGQFLADDTVNAVSGRWVSTPSGYRVSSSGTTLVAYAGTDSTKLEAMIAIDSVTVAEANVTAHITGTALTLAVPKYTLTFMDAGAAVSFPPPSPTTTLTPN